MTNKQHYFNTLSLYWSKEFNHDVWWSYRFIWSIVSVYLMIFVRINYILKNLGFSTKTAPIGRLNVCSCHERGQVTKSVREFGNGNLHRDPEEEHISGWPTKTPRLLWSDVSVGKDVYTFPALSNLSPLFSFIFIHLQATAIPLLCLMRGKASPSSTPWSASPSPCWCWPPACRGSCIRWSTLQWGFCSVRAWSLGQPPWSTSSCWWFWYCSASSWLRQPCSTCWKCPGPSWMPSTFVSSPCAPSDWAILCPVSSPGRNTDQSTKSASWVSAAVVLSEMLLDSRLIL